MLQLNPLFIRCAKVLANALLKNDEEDLEDILLLVHDCLFRLVMDACFGERMVLDSTTDRLRVDYFLCIGEARPQAVHRMMLRRIFSFAPPQGLGFKECVKGAIILTLK